MDTDFNNLYKSKVKDFQLWPEENRKEIRSLYTLVGRYVMTYSELQSHVERAVFDHSYFFTRHKLRSTKFSGRPFGKFKNGEAKLFLEFLTKLAERSPYIYTKKEEKQTKIEIKRLHSELKTIHELRNALVYGFWDDWSPKYPHIVLSVERTYRGQRVYTVSKQCIVDWTRSIELLIIDFSDFEMRYRFGWDVEEPKIKTSWYRNKIQKGHEEFLGRQKLRKLKNIGFHIEQLLTNVGLYSPDKLEEAGYEKAYQMIINEGYPRSEKLKFSLRGALENKSWKEYKLDSKNNLKVKKKAR